MVLVGRWAPASFRRGRLAGGGQVWGPGSAGRSRGAGSARGPTRPPSVRIKGPAGEGVPHQAAQPPLTRWLLEPTQPVRASTVLLEQAESSSDPGWRRARRGKSSSSCPTCRRPPTSFCCTWALKYSMLRGSMAAAARPPARS